MSWLHIQVLHPAGAHQHCINIREFIEGLACDYYGDTYHLISKNCNHFTDDVSTKLVGRRIPGWVNRLAKLGACVDMYYFFFLFL